MKNRHSETYNTEGLAFMFYLFDLNKALIGINHKKRLKWHYLKSDIRALSNWSLHLVGVQNAQISAKE